MLHAIFVKSTTMDVWRALAIPLTCCNTCNYLTLSWRRPLLFRNQSIDLLCKSMDWFLHDRDLHHEIFKYFWIHKYIKQFWCYHMYQHQNITSVLVFTLVFGIHCNFSLFYQFDYKFVDLMVFFFFTRQNLHTQKIGHISEVLHAQACPIGIGCVICPGLYLHFFYCKWYWCF